MVQWLREHVVLVEDIFDPQHPQDSSQSTITLVQFNEIQYATDGIYTCIKKTLRMPEVNNTIVFKDGKMRRACTPF